MTEEKTRPEGRRAWPRLLARLVLSSFLALVGSYLVYVLLVVLLIPPLGNEQKTRLAQVQCENISLALQVFETDCGRYPTTDEGLTVLVKGSNIAGWGGPYIEGAVTRDPWGRPFHYYSEAGVAKLVSPGPDGTLLSPDDIVVFPAAVNLETMRGLTNE